MNEIKVGDIVYGDPECQTLASNFHNVKMRVVEINSSNDKEKVLDVELLDTHKIELALEFSIMEYAVKKNLDYAGRVPKAEKDYYERVGYWDTYFNGLEPLRVL